MGSADAHRRVAATFVVEVGKQRLEGLAVTRVTGEKDVVLADRDVVECELGLGAPAQAHLLVHAGDAHAARGEVDDGRADALGALATREPAPHEAGDRLSRVRLTVCALLSSQGERHESGESGSGPTESRPL